MHDLYLADWTTHEVGVLEMLKVMFFLGVFRSEEKIGNSS